MQEHSNQAGTADASFDALADLQGVYYSGVSDRNSSPSIQVSLNDGSPSTWIEKLGSFLHVLELNSKKENSSNSNLIAEQ